MNTVKLMGKTIVITGASSGVGRSAALEFAQYGAALVLAGRNEKILQEVADECKDSGAEVLVAVTDVSDADAMVRLANAANDWQGKIDVWINNAGVLAAGDFDITPMAVHRQVILTNLVGYMNGAHAVLPFFKEQRYGILINNISIGGFLPVPYGSGYTASKFGLKGFSEAIKGELTAWPDIHICDLFPAFLDTPGIQHAANFTGKALKPAPPVYDPLKVARAMVRVALCPKSNTYIGAMSRWFKTGHALFPQLMVNGTAGFMRKYFKAADPITYTHGNVFETVDYGMSTHGNAAHMPRPTRKFLAAGFLAGLAIGVLMIQAGRK